MECNCACLGMASAARVPVKRYNLLVPDVFPVVEPPFDRTLSITVERKVKKVAEYLENNEHRAPKVSRRLQRRLYSELRRGGYGYVKLAVQTYSYLLTHSRPEKSSLLANELVVRTVVKRRRLLFGLAGPLQDVPFPEPHLGSTVGLLLTHNLPRLRKLGVDLLIDFIKCQQTSDYVPQLEAFVPLLCQNAKPQTTLAAGGAAAGSGRSFEREAAAVAAEEHWSALRAACLRALLEHLRFCARLSYVSYHLHTITFAVLVCVDASGRGVPQGHYQSPRAALEHAGSGELARLDTLSRLSISHAIGASPPDIAALLVFEELAHMTRDAAEGKKVLEFVMRFLDAHGRWLGSPVAETSIAVLQQACEQEHQRYLLFSTLLRHVAMGEQLSPAERGAVLQLAVAEGAQLEAGLAAPALLLALRELPAVVASHNGSDGEDVPPVPALPAAAGTPTVLAAGLPGQQQHALASNGTTAAAAGVGGGAVPVQQEIELPRVALQSRPSAKLTLAAAAAAAVRGPVDLHLQVLTAVTTLARRVQDSGQLVEAVSGTITKLRGAAPITSAALQCCVAAAEVVQDAPQQMPRAPGSMARTFPSLLLQELAGVTVLWGPQQRLLAHALLLQLLPAAVDGLRDQQALILLSAVWYEAALPSNSPAAFVAMDCTLKALLGTAPAAALPEMVKMLAALQLEVLQAGGLMNGDASAAAGKQPADLGSSRRSGRLAELPAAQACALLCVSRSVLHALAVQLGQPALEQLAVPGCEAVLPQLAVGQAGVNDVAGGVVVGGQQQQECRRFWQGPAVVQQFSTEDQHQAAAFLASWQQASGAEQQQAALSAALLAVPLFTQQQAGAAAPDNSFQPLPQSALLPRLMRDGGAYANGSDHSSKRANRLRNVYKHMRQTSLLDGDRAMLATISQESAAEEAPGSALQLPSMTLLGLPGGQGSGSAAAPAKSVDDVLDEVDAALAAAEEAVRGHTPSSAAWHQRGAGRAAQLGGGSTGDLRAGAQGGGGGSGGGAA